MIYKRQYSYIYLPAILVLSMWLVKFIEYYYVLDFKYFGIYPRDIKTLPGIFFSPFIHGDFKHLLGNSMPIFLLSAAILFFYRKMAYQIIFLSWILTGTSVWLGGRYSYHIGASGLVYAFFSFLFFSGVLNKERKLISISLLVIFLYGGLIWGVLPTNSNISWESHLFGFAIGFILAYFFGKEYLYSEPKITYSQPEDYIEKSSTHDLEYEIRYWFNDKPE